MTKTAEDRRLLFIPIYVYLISGFVLFLVLFRLCHAYKTRRSQVTPKDVKEKETAHKLQIMDSILFREARDNGIKCDERTMKVME